MKVLIADRFERSGLDGLRAAGCEVVSQPDVAGADLVESLRAHRPDVLVVRSTRVTAEMLDVDSLALVVRAGAGVNAIDVGAASARGVYVASCPGKNSIAVAELTLGLLLALDRRIPDQVADLRAGRWRKSEYAHAAGLYGRTLGVVGLGSIGAEVVRRAHAFGMRVVAWSRRFDGEDRWLTMAEARELDLEGVHQHAPIRLAPAPAEVAARCDALTVHVALAPETRGLIGAEVLGRLRPGAFFVNTARSEIVDTRALETAARDRGLRVALDVFAREPAGGEGEFDDPISELPFLYGTHHVGASTDQAQAAIAAETVRVVRTFLETGRVPNCVNLAHGTPATHRLVVRHRDRPGVLAHVFDRLRDAGINVQETENVVFEGARAAVARVHLDGEPGAEILAAIRDGHPDVLDVRVVRV